MVLKLIACEVFYREACMSIATSPHRVDVEFTDKGAHNDSAKLRALLQAKIDASEAAPRPWDAILLVAEIYRLTGRFSWNAGHEFWGRYASLKDLLVPTGMVLGGRDEFEELLRRNETFTAGQHAEPAGESRYRGWRVVLNRFVWRAHIFTVGSLVVWAEINARCSNSLSLKGLDLPAALRATRSMEEATREADVAGTKAAIVGWRI